MQAQELRGKLSRQEAVSMLLLTMATLTVATLTLATTYSGYTYCGYAYCGYAYYEQAGGRLDAAAAAAAYRTR